MNQYEIENAVELIDGYYLRKPNQSISDAFEEAKEELVKNLSKQLENVKLVDFDKWYNQIKK